MTELPELPEPDGESRGCRFHTEAQMRSYGEQCFALGMERAASLAEAEHIDGPLQDECDGAYNTAVRHCVEAIRAAMPRKGEAR